MRLNTKLFVEPFYKMAEPLLLTYDNAPTKNTKFFIETLKQNKWQHRLIGEGEVWEGFINKMKGYLRTVNELPDDQLVVLADARDVMCVRPPNYFRQAFLSFGGKVVVSMELMCESRLTEDKTTNVMCVPINKYYAYHNIVNKPTRRFVNSGLIAGYAKDLRHVWTWIVERNYKDDQGALCDYVNAFPQNIHLDGEAELFHTSNYAFDCATQNLKIQNADSPSFGTLLGTGAFFLHICGLRCSKGQQFIYDTSVDFLKKLNGTKLNTVYNYSPVKWNEIHNYDKT